MEADKGKRCSYAIMAAMELMREECGGGGVFKVLDDGLLIYIPDEFIKEFEEKTGHKFGNPLTPGTEEFEKALEACMHGKWARNLVEKMLGEDAPEEAKEKLLRKVCMGLLT